MLIIFPKIYLNQNYTKDQMKDIFFCLSLKAYLIKFTIQMNIFWHISEFEFANIKCSDYPSINAENWIFSICSNFYIAVNFSSSYFLGWQICRSIERKIEFDLCKRKPYFSKEIIQSRLFLIGSKKNYDFLEP